MDAIYNNSQRIWPENPKPCIKMEVQAIAKICTIKTDLIDKKKPLSLFNLICYLAKSKTKRNEEGSLVKRTVSCRFFPIPVWAMNQLAENY